MKLKGSSTRKLFGGVKVRASSKKKKITVPRVSKREGTAVPMEIFPNNSNRVIDMDIDYEHNKQKVVNMDGIIANNQDIIFFRPATQPKYNINDKFDKIPHRQQQHIATKDTWLNYTLFSTPTTILVTTLELVSKHNNLSYVVNSANANKRYSQLESEGIRRYIDNDLFNNVFDFLTYPKVNMNSKQAKLQSGRVMPLLLDAAYTEQINIAMEFMTQFNRYLDIQFDETNKRVAIRIPDDQGNYLYYELGRLLSGRLNFTFNKVVIVDFTNVAFRLANYLNKQESTFKEKIDDATIFMNKICSQLPDTLFFVVSNSTIKDSKLPSVISTILPGGSNSIPNWIHINISLKTKLDPTKTKYMTMSTEFGFSEVDDIVLLGFYTYFSNCLSNNANVSIFSFDNYDFYTSNYKPIIYYKPFKANANAIAKGKPKAKAKESLNMKQPLTEIIYFRYLIS